MAKFDTSTIGGFDEMTAEEKVTALLGVQLPDPVNLAEYVKKDVFDAKASEAASLQRQLHAKTTEAETIAASLATAQGELTSLKQSAYVASKGYTGDEAEFIAFKASKMVNNKTTFEQAVDTLAEKRKEKPKVDMGGSVGGGDKKTDNNAMNDLIRGAFK